MASGIVPTLPPARPVAIAVIGPLRAALSVSGAAHRVRLGAHQELGHRLDNLAQQINIGLF
jgi:DNA-binding IclR family transcriptional regulator